jgi:hypothetical protein
MYNTSTLLKLFCIKYILYVIPLAKLKSALFASLIATVSKRICEHFILSFVSPIQVSQHFTSELAHLPRLDFMVAIFAISIVLFYRGSIEPLKTTFRVGSIRPLWCIIPVRLPAGPKFLIAKFAGERLNPDNTDIDRCYWT